MVCHLLSVLPSVKMGPSLQLSRHMAKNKPKRETLPSRRKERKEIPVTRE